MRILTIKDHFFLLMVIFSILFIDSNFSKVNLETVVLEILILYVFFFALFTFPSTKGSVYQKYAVQRRKKYNDVGTVISNNPELTPVYKTIYDLKRHITKRNNKNVFISGRSGSGKTTLMRYIINLFPTSNKVIFSFKAHDDYLKLGIPIIHVSEYAANPFTDKEAFVQAFLVAYPVDYQGITSQAAPSLLRALVKESNSWEELKSNIAIQTHQTSDRITISAYNFILQKIGDLELSTVNHTIDMTQSLVLDFSGMNESAKTFYSELYLRQVWQVIEESKVDKSNPMPFIIIVDESHRLLRSRATILNDVAREIRAKGALFCGTQNYADIQDSVRNQFAIHFVFITRSKNDITDLEAINDLFPYVMREIEDYYFMDAAATKQHKAIPIYTTDIRDFKEYDPKYLKPDITEAKTEEKVGNQDYTNAVLKILDKEASWSNDIARRIATELNIDTNNAKLHVSKVLTKLYNEGLVGSELLRINDNEIILYYKRDSSLSGLHKFIEQKVTAKLDRLKIVYELPNGREGVPDISTAEFDIEIETGLKNDLKPFVERLQAKTKRTIVIVPNDDQKERYQRAITPPNVEILTLGDYLKRDD